MYINNKGQFLTYTDARKHNRTVTAEQKWQQLTEQCSGHLLQILNVTMFCSSGIDLK